MLLAVDSETTGVDLYHAARPFFFTTCNTAGEQEYWEWDVDPFTRAVAIPNEDLDHLTSRLTKATALVLQNPKFDVTALASVRPSYQWPWHKTNDTLVAGHLLASNKAHDLTSMALQYLGVDISPVEERLRHCVNEARRLTRTKAFRDKYGTWMIAEEGLPGMPSADGGSKKDKKGVESEKPWKFDCWLPRAVAQAAGYAEGHEYWTVLRDYANTDSETTLLLWKVMRQELENRGLWKIYELRRKIIPIAYRIERNGVTLSKQRLDELTETFESESAAASSVCLNLASGLGYDLELPKGSSNNKSLHTFCFSPQGLALPPVKRSEKTGEPSLDKYCLDHYDVSLPASSKGQVFVNRLKVRRKCGTALTYMRGYRDFWLPTGVCNEDGEQMWYKVHPNINQTGTDTLRWSSSNPNEQNISKQEGYNTRYAFGPAPGREWYSCDAENIELRIPAYVSGEQAMIQLFERPNDPPYFGSNHLLVSHILHPKLFEECRSCLDCKKEEWCRASTTPRVKCCTCPGVKIVDGRVFKKRYASTWYQWVKNGNFAVTYGAVAESGTADRAYHVPGAQRIIENHFTKIKELNQQKIRMANRLGYVETLPDKTVDPSRGYPLLCTRSEWGKILPTVPLNYFSQGTACWWMLKAMLRCDQQLQAWHAEDGFDGFITMQVHDELDFDFPKVGNPLDDLELERTGKVVRGQRKGYTSNLWRVRVIQQLMAQGGDDIGLPTPVSAEYHAENWAEGVKLTV